MKRFLPKLSFVFTFCVCAQTIFAQCTLGGIYGSGTAGTTCVAVSTPPNNCHFIDEYAEFTGLTIGETYLIGSNVPVPAGTTTITTTGAPYTMTLFDGAGAVLTSSVNAVNNLINISFTATTTTVLIQMNTASCGTSGSYCHYYGLQCTSCPAAGTPICATLTAPTDAATGISTTPTLTWSTTANASSYDVFIGTANPPLTLLANVTGTSYTVLSGAGLVASTLYYWYAIPKACDNTFPTGCTPFSFTTASACVAPTALTAGSITSTSASLNWTEGGSSTTWDVEIQPAPFTFTGTPTVTGVAKPYVVMGLTPSTMYQFKASGAGCNLYSAASATFTTLAPPPANDLCADAIVIPCDGSVSGNNTSATDEVLPGITCGATGTTATYKGMWYKVTPANSGSMTISTCTGTAFDTYLRVYEGACGAFTACTGSNDDGCTTYSSLTFTAVGGTTYYVMLTGYNAAAFGAFTISATCPAACPAPPQPTMSAITMTSAIATWAGASSYILEYGPTGYTPGTAGAAGATGTLIDPAVSPQSITGLAVATTYDLYVRNVCAGPAWSPNSPVRTFTTLAPPPVNDDPCGAIALTVASSCTFVVYNNNSATGTTGVLAPGCASYSTGDVWFKVTVPACGALIFDTDQGTIIDSGMAIYSSSDNTCSGTFALIECNDDGSGSGMSLISRTDLVPGATIFVRFWDFFDLFGTFGICVSEPAPMIYVSSTTNQGAVTAIAAGDVNKDIVRLEVTVIGNSCAMKISEIKFNTTGTTDLTALTNAKVYYTGTSSTFSTTTAFGTVVMNPSGVLTFTNPTGQVLTGGVANTTNYFWLAYDISPCFAAASQVADGQSIDFSFLGGAANVVPTVTNPAGTRAITPTSGAAFTSIADGPWSASATWGGCPPMGSPTTITVNSNVTVDGATTVPPSANLVINSGKKLTLGSGSILNVGPTGGGKQSLTINGTLEVNDGTLNHNGNFILSSAGKLTQSGGDINIDGNAAGVAANSVTSGTVLINLTIAAAADLSLSGGTFTIIDPHVAATLALQVTYSVVGNVSASPTHTFRFGNGVSTDPGGLNGFDYYGWSGSGIFRFGNVILKGSPSGSNRFVFMNGTFDNFAVTGNLTVEANAELRQTTTSTTGGSLVFAGNITNNGTITSIGGMYLGNATSSSATGLAFSAATTAQTISGSGLWRNLTASPTANMTSPTVNNTSGTPTPFPASMTTGVGTGSVSSTLTLTNGAVTPASSLTVGISGTVQGTIAHTNGWVNGTIVKWVSAATGLRDLPVGTATTKRTIGINFTAAPTVHNLTANFNASNPTTTGLPVTTQGITAVEVSPTGYWTVSASAVQTAAFTATVNASGFTQINGSSLITNFPEIKLGKRSGGVYATAGTSGSNTALSAISASALAGFSDFVIIGTAAALPIELKSFTGKVTNATNTLSWETETEVNVQEFSLERSADGKQNWRSIGTKTAIGNSNILQKYELEDRAPIAIAYYRLKTIDRDGQFQFSNLIVLARARETFGIASAFPIPTLDKLNVQFETIDEGTVTLRLTDLAGRLVFLQKMDALKGINTVEISLTNLQTGAYFLTLDNGSTISAPTKVVKQ